MACCQRIVLYLFALMQSLFISAQVNNNDINELFSCINQEENTEVKVDCYIALANLYRQVSKDSSLLFAQQAYELSDKIRDLLKKHKVIISDNKEGSTWEFKDE